MFKSLIKTAKTAFLSPKGTISSKRLTGFLMITHAGFEVCFYTFKGIDIPPNLTSLIMHEITFGSALLSSTIFEKKFKSLNDESKS